MKKLFKYIISILIVVTLVILGLKGVRYLVTDDTRSFTRIMMHEFYNQDENIDILFVGSSHCYRSIIPSVIDEEMNCHSFNAGSSAQRMDGSLALVKECLNYYEPKEIVLDIYYDMIDTIAHSEREELRSTYVLSDYMRFSINKISYLLQASSMDKYVNSFIVGRRDWKNLLDFGYVSELWSKKSSDNYKNYIWTLDEADEGYYVDRGYVAFDGKAETSELSYTDSDNIHIEMNKFTDEWQEELEEIIELCNENNIKLTIVAAPLPEYTYTLIDNYEEYAEYMKNMLNDYKVSYIDFNLAEYKIDSITDDCFKDKDHLNSKGANIYSARLAKILSNAN